MAERFDFSTLLNKAEQRIIERPSSWIWVSSLIKSDLKSIRHPEYREWARDNAHTHAPPQRELFLTLSGRSLFMLGDKVYRTAPGVVMMFNSRERHDFQLSPWNRGFRHLWLHISNRHSVASNLHQVGLDGEQTDTPLKLMSGHNPQLIMDLWDRCENPETFSGVHFAFLQSVISTSLFEALSDWSNRVTTHPHHLVVDSIRDYIHQNLDKDLNLNHLSRLAGYSPYFFHRLFLRYAKRTLHLYIIEAKMERAKELLQVGQSVNAVSDQIGMASASYFSRFFKKHTTFTPAMWREVHSVQK